MSEPEPYELSQQFIVANGLSFHYALDGDEAAPVLALINMASHNLTCWEPVLELLRPHFRILRFDIRGTGKSAWGAADGFTFTQYAADLAAIMDALNIEQAMVVGVAYGARTAARFALHHPDRLTALGLFDVALTPPVEQTGQRALADEARTLLVANGTPAPMLRKSWRFYEDRDAALQAHTAHEGEPDITEALAHLNKPVLVACGRQDMNLAAAQQIAQTIDGAQFAMMEMTGHASPFFRPDLFAQLLIDFKTTTLP